MNTDEAKTILNEQLELWRLRSFSDLTEFVDTQVYSEVVGPSGARYQIEIQPFWDDRGGGNIRVMDSIDEGGKSVLRPLSDDFIISPDGRFVAK